MKHSKIETVDDERAFGNSLIVTLKRGWRFEAMGEHVRGYDTKREAMREVRAAQPCVCSECSGGANGVGECQTVETLQEPRNATLPARSPIGRTYPTSPSRAAVVGERIEQANSYLNDVDLPPYEEVVKALHYLYVDVMCEPGVQTPSLTRALEVLGRAKEVQLP